jgi:hypothetical protein
MHDVEMAALLFQVRTTTFIPTTVLLFVVAWCSSGRIVV